MWQDKEARGLTGGCPVRFPSVLVLTALGFAAPLGGGHALADPPRDVVGVYFDLAAAASLWQTHKPSELVTAYVIATNISAPAGIGAFEMMGRIKGAAVAPSWELPPSVIDCPEPGCLVWAGSQPLPWSPAILLATLRFWVPTTSAGCAIYLGPTACPSLPGSVAYVAGMDPSDFRPLTAASGSFDLPLAVVNGGPSVPLLSGSWGSCKALFR